MGGLTMSKARRVMVLAVVICLITAAARSPTTPRRSTSSGTRRPSSTATPRTFGNQGTGSPHQNYLEGTEKCGVCHSVHRAPVPFVKWDTNPSDPASKTPVAGGQYNRLELSDSDNTQMLLLDSVANSCNYCHVYTSIGNKQLYAGKMEYINSEDAFGTDEWDEGFGHHNGCTGATPCTACRATSATPRCTGSTAHSRARQRPRSSRCARRVGGAGTA